MNTIKQALAVTVATAALVGCASDRPPHYHGSRGHNANGVMLVREYTPVLQTKPREWGRHVFVPGYARQGVVVSPSRTWTYGQGEGWASAKQGKPHISVQQMSGRTFDRIREPAAPDNDVAHSDYLSDADGKVHRFHFAFDKDRVTGLGRNALRQEAEHLVTLFEDNPEARAVIIGYTDSTGPSDYNLQLSRQRAEAVRRFLMAHGVPEARLSTRGRGESNPIASNSSRTGRLDNRRVEIRVIITDKSHS